MSTSTTVNPSISLSPSRSSSVEHNPRGLFAWLRGFADRRPVLFVIAVAVFFPVMAIPLVVLFRGLGQDLVPLRLIVPTVQSVFVLWIIRKLGWWQKAGLTGTVRNLHVLWFPTLVAFVPVLFYGTIEVDWRWIVFYGAAVLATGISEEGLARGIAIPVLLRYGKWAAVVIAAAIFSAGHLTNAFFEDFGVLEWVDKFTATFGFAILYGAVFLRTGNLWPLIVLHTIHDYSYVTSGTAGPFAVGNLDLRLHMLLSALYAVYGLVILARTKVEPERIGNEAAASAAALA